MPSSRLVVVFGAAVVLALLSGCSVDGVTTSDAAPRPTPSTSGTTVPSASPSPTTPADPAVALPGAPEPISSSLPDDGSPSPLAVPVQATFTFACRDADLAYTPSTPPQVFPSLAAVWADPRSLSCIPSQSDNTFTQVELDAARLSFTGGSYPGLDTDVGHAVTNLYFICARKDVPTVDAQRPASSRAGDRIMIRAALMVCPNHPLAAEMLAI